MKITFDGKNFHTNGKLNLDAFRHYMSEEDAEKIAGKVDGLIADLTKQVAMLINERIAKNS